MQALVVIDDVETKDVLRQAFEIGFHESGVTYIDSGRRCLEYMKINSPDIIVVDTLLRDYDGYELIKKIRKLSDVPILMLSYIKDEFQLVKALELGVDDYVVKPVHSMEIIARIRALTKRQARNNTM